MSDELVSRIDLITGGILVVVGFALAIGWEAWKDARETAQRNKALNDVIASDLAINRMHVEFSLKLLNEELLVLPKGMSVVQPLPLLQDSFWDVVKLNPPTDLITSGKLEKLNKLMAVTSVINDQAESRETYRLQNGAMSNFNDRMRMYDQLLVEQLGILQRQIDDYSR